MSYDSIDPHAYIHADCIDRLAIYQWGAMR